MSALLDCPRIESWQALFADELPADQRESYERHLESCRACQERLDRAAAGEDPLVILGRQVGDPTLTPADPTLELVIDLLHEVKRPPRTAAEEPIDLYFLQATERPDI